MLEELSSINKEALDHLKKAGIDTVEKLALKKVEDLVEIQGFTIMSAVKYIQEAIDYINSKQEGTIDKIAKKKTSSAKTRKSKSELSKKKKIANKKDPINLLDSLSTKVLNKLDLEETAAKTSSQRPNLINMTAIPQKSKPLKKPVVPQKSKPIKKSVAPQKSKPIKKSVTPQQPKKEIEIGYIKDLFPEEIILRIRFLHFKLKNLERTIDKPSEEVSYDDLDLFSEYIDLLNINYKTKNQNLVIKELAITTSYTDPVDNQEIDIYDIMFECARVSWVLARLYAHLSNNFEKVDDWENSITSMVRCSKMYKTAAYFSAATVNQNKKSKSLEPKNLEFESEQSRILAQSLAANKEEKEGSLILASKLYSGLSSLSMRLFYLGFFDEKIKNQLKAQSSFDMGKACYMNAKALQKLEISETLDQQTHIRLIEDLFKKAVYYFSKSEEIWEYMLKKFKEITEKEKKNILFNLSVVNDNIMEIDVEVYPFEELKNIKNPEPYIVVPENLAEKLPRTTLYLSNIKPMDMNVEIYRKYKIKNLEKPNLKRKKEELLSRKTSIGRTIKELRSLYDNNDIDIGKYTELYELYTTKLNNIELDIQKLAGPINQDKKKKK